MRMHRWSEAGSCYFITLCTAEKVSGLTSRTVASAIRHEIDACERDGHWHTHAGVIMPDHIHLLVTLIGKLPLGRVIARLKAKTKHALADLNLRWQGNFYEHHMRESDAIEDVLRYLFLNPYRAGLTIADTIYPWFWLGTEEAQWFNPTLANARPPPEWLK